MAKSITTIGGLDVSLWVGRPVRVNRSNGRPYNARLKSISANGKTAVVQCPGHPTLSVDAQDIIPWWAENPDLKEKASSASVRVIDVHVEEKSANKEQRMPVTSPSLIAMKNEHQSKLDAMKAKRVSFTIGDLLSHKDEILGNLGNIVSQASDLETTINELTEQIELAQSADDSFSKVCDAMGAWIQ